MSVTWSTDALCSAIEGRFELGQIQWLSTELLGLDSVPLEGAVTKASFTRALVDQCARNGMLVALVDVLVLQNPEARERLWAAYHDAIPDDLIPGKNIASFELTRKDGSDEFGLRFTAVSSDGEPVTVAVLSGPETWGLRGLQRYLVVQRALRGIDHPAIQKILRVGQLSDGRPYVVSKCMEGQKLSTRLANESAMHPQEAHPLLQKIAAGLDRVHAMGIMHGDLRTENVVLVRRDDEITGVLTNFGIDRLVDVHPGGAEMLSLRVPTAAAKALAPERVREGTPSEIRSEVYALGVLAYEVLTGRPPFAGSRPIDLIVGHLHETPEPPSGVARRGWVTSGLDAVVLKALAKDPAKRFASAGEFINALGEALKGEGAATLAPGELWADKATERASAASAYQSEVDSRPDDRKLLAKLMQIYSEVGDWERLLEVILRLAALGDDPAHRSKYYATAAQLCDEELGRGDQAIRYYELALEHDPANERAIEGLGLLREAKEGRSHFEKAVGAQRELLLRDSTRVETYQALRRVYTAAKRPDEVWGLCQVLTALSAAAPEEQNFFEKFRAGGPAAAVQRVDDDLWISALKHPRQDTLLTALFATITPVVLEVQGEKHEAYGLSEANTVDPAREVGAMVQTLRHAAGVLGVKPPRLYTRPDDDSGLNLACTNPPALFLGQAALAKGPWQAMAFLAGHRLSYLRPGHFFRQIVHTGGGLRAWLLAAIQLVNPGVSVPSELVDAVRENSAVLARYLTLSHTQLLSSLVSKLLHDAGALDLRQWISGVDLTADRAGFLLTNDLPKVLAVVRATPEDASALNREDRVRELLLFASSEEYFRLRHQLGIAIRSHGNATSGSPWSDSARS